MSDGVVIAVDVGGTAIKGTVVDAAGHFMTRVSRPTGADRGPDDVVAELLGVITELRAHHGDARAVGVVVPGVVDAAAGVAEFAANLGFRELPLRSLLEQATGLPVLLEHDVHAAGVAERAIGRAAGVDDCLLAVIGTGIAAVVQAAGSNVRGATRVAGELGHIPVWPDGEPCPCGQRGCLERYASAASIVRRYTELSGSELASAVEVAARRERDPHAQRAWDEATEALAIAFATCTMLLDPALIILAGGLSQAGEALLVPVGAALARRVSWRDPPPLVLSELGGRAGLVGAAVLTWRSLGVARFDSWAPIG
jgi:glucokinase